MISAANEAGDRNNPINAVQIRLRASLMGQKDCVILPQLSARLGLRQGQVTFSMMWPRSSISASIGLERSGMAPIATEKNTAKITIWRISFCAIASAIEVGIKWVRYFSIENADTGKPVDCILSGTVPGKFQPRY